MSLFCIFSFIFDLTPSQANNTSGWVQYPSLLIYFNSILTLNNVLNLLVGPMKVHDLLFEPRSLVRSKSEVLEVITAMLICIIITNLWLNKVRAKQRMCYKRTWKPAMRTQLLHCRTSNLNIWVHLMLSAFQSERSIVAQVCTQIDIRDKTKFFMPQLSQFHFYQLWSGLNTQHNYVFSQVGCQYL